MSLQQQFTAEGIEWRQYDDGDRTEFVADFGPQGRSTADVVGDTVIVVADGEQYEFELDRDARAFMTNGVLTIEVNR
jgi:hypothetical protein